MDNRAGFILSQYQYIFCMGLKWVNMSSCHCTCNQQLTMVKFWIYVGVISCKIFAWFIPFIFLRFSVFFLLHYLLPFHFYQGWAKLWHPTSFYKQTKFIFSDSGINRCKGWTLSFQLSFQYLRTADIIVLDSQSPANCAVQNCDLRFLTAS